VAKYSLAVRNKGHFFRVRRDYEGGHDTQHFGKHVREQLRSKLPSVTRENSVRGIETKHVLTTRILVIGPQRLKRKRMSGPQCVNIILLYASVSHFAVQAN
jgi:hypothetical protein